MSEFGRIQTERLKAAIAAEIGCAPAGFSTDSLTVVEAPAAASDRYLSRAFTFGQGTVLSVRPALLEWAGRNAPEVHYETLSFPFLTDLVREAHRMGFESHLRGQGYGFVLESEPAPGEPPDGFRVIELPRDQARALRLAGRFSVPLDGTDSDDPENVRATLALTDPSGEPRAIATVWDRSFERSEVGVEVERDFRARGFAPVVVRAATAWIVGSGRTPFYRCDASNVRSIRTAVSSGYRPAWSWISVRLAQT